MKNGVGTRNRYEFVRRFFRRRSASNHRNVPECALSTNQMAQNKFMEQIRHKETQNNGRLLITMQKFKMHVRRNHIDSDASHNIHDLFAFCVCKSYAFVRELRIVLATKTAFPFRFCQIEQCEKTFVASQPAFMTSCRRCSFLNILATFSAGIQFLGLEARFGAIRSSCFTKQHYSKF